MHCGNNSGGATVFILREQLRELEEDFEIS